VNVGTPESPMVKDVRKYLSQFLNDPRVIDIPPVFRKMLVELIIVPFRAPRSAKLYSRLWTENGSPLLVHLNNLLLRAEVSEEPINANGAHAQDNEPGTLSFYVAMRYGNPSLEGILEHVRNKGHDHITVFPLYPQYSSATTGSVIDLVNKVTGGWGEKPEIDTVKQFYSSPSFIKPLAAKIRAAGTESCHRIVFSYHGLPVRHLQKENPACNPATCSCDKHMPDYGTFCYRAACYETSRLLAAELGLGKEKYVTTFQSRLTRSWLEPFTDQTLISLARSGAGRVIIATPSFVADCLETTIEIGEDCRRLFTENGGRELVVVGCLNEELDVYGILAGEDSLISDQKSAIRIKR